MSETAVAYHAGPDRHTLHFPSDVGTRREWFVERSFTHPAKLQLGLLAWLIDRYSAPGDTVADPMAGSGSLLLAAGQQRHVIVRDVEPNFLALLHENAAHVLRRCGLFAGNIDIGAHDAREPWGYHADAIITSPPYACAASSTPNQRRFLPSKLASIPGLRYDQRWAELAAHNSPSASGAVRFFYGNHPAQVGAFRGPRYWEAMRAVYTQAHAALRPGGLLILVIKDHVKDGQRVHVADDTALLCAGLGFTLHERHVRALDTLSLWQRRRRERGQLVVLEEDVLCFRGVS